MLINPPFYIKTIESVKISLDNGISISRSIEDFEYFYADSRGNIRFKLKASANVPKEDDVLESLPFNDIIKFRNIRRLFLQFNNGTTKTIMTSFRNIERYDYNDYEGGYEVIMNLDENSYIDSDNGLVVSVEGW